MNGAGRARRVLARLAVLSVAAAACAMLVQRRIVAGVAPAIAGIVAQVPRAGSGAGSAAGAAAESASASEAASGAAAGSAAASASEAASGAAPERSSTMPRIVRARPIASARAGATAPHVTRAEIDDAIAHKLDGASAKLVRDARGAPIGLAIQRPGRLARLGVASGDVLYAANGVRIRTPDEGLAALAQLEKATRVVVTFRRGEGSYAIVVDIAP